MNCVYTFLANDTLVVDHIESKLYNNISNGSDVRVSRYRVFFKMKNDSLDPVRIEDFKNDEWHKSKESHSPDIFFIKRKNIINPK